MLPVVAIPGHSATTSAARPLIRVLAPLFYGVPAVSHKVCYCSYHRYSRTERNSTL